MITSGYAQTVIGMGTETPNPHAVLELVPENSNQGFLAPRLSTGQRTAPSFTDQLTDTDNGLLVFDTDEGRFFHWFDGAWRSNGRANDTPAVNNRDFAVWYSGSTAPNGISANEGDFYIDESSGEVYKYRGGAFTTIGTLSPTGGSVESSTPQELADVLSEGNDADGSRIVNLGSPVAGSDAATKDYVTEQINNLPAGAPPLATVLESSNDANSNQIKNLADPTEEQDAATKEYVDDKIGAIPIITGVPTASRLDEVLERSNDADSKKIVNLSDPEDGQDAATKAYVDNRIVAPVSTLPAGQILIGSPTNTPVPVTVDGHVTMELDGSINLKNNAVSRDKINANVAGLGLSQNGNGSLQVNLSGDVTTNGDELEVVGLQGYPVSDAAPGSGQGLLWNGSEWTPSDLLSGSARRQWYDGNNVPNNGNPSGAQDGDYFYRKSSGVVYLREGGTWNELGGFTHTGGTTTDGARQNGLLNITQPTGSDRRDGTLWIDSNGDGAIKVWNSSIDGGTGGWVTILSGD